jgi:hypothetical protein
MIVQFLFVPSIFGTIINTPSLISVKPDFVFLLYFKRVLPFKVHLSGNLNVSAPPPTADANDQLAPGDVGDSADFV